MSEMWKSQERIAIALEKLNEQIETHNNLMKEQNRMINEIIHHLRTN